ncbi:LOW QUALITY PROTEIN: uncharacterized protein [Argopecten irradians]|uniref:LOW QUALITY PROTEIN: uncharacterized protein n=1 Tax=Argopecten irradians TaxID=31199 RepID=UPI003714429E
MNLTSKQREALDIVNEGHNLFLGGPAGTGKSFLLCEIVKALRLSGKCVHLTCTTGIACTNFPPELGAMTVHRWSGIQDGRYKAQEVISLIKSHAKFQDALHRIKNTDTLIIDEVSMLSERLFNLLAEVCTIKDSSKQFGGMQLIMCGDFVQLPPVPNMLYNDDGKYCFESPLFEQLLCHKIYLNEIVRQNDQQLIRSIWEVSFGEVSDDTLMYIKTLQRPLSPDQQSIKLFATTHLVDNYNRKCVVEARGVVGEYLAEDTGENRHLSRLMAPKILWLKVGSPVILLRNISKILFNGLRGTVLAVEPDGPVVNFPTANQTLKIPKMTFTGILCYNDDKIVI